MKVVVAVHGGAEIYAVFDADLKDRLEKFLDGSDVSIEGPFDVATGMGQWEDES